MTLVNGHPAEVISVADRGLLYGDGLFETLRMVAGRCPLWALHLDRLLDGCGRIGIPEPEPATLEAEIRRAAEGRDCTVRLTVTRGAGPRGYAPPRAVRSTRIVQAFELPRRVTGALTVKICETRLSPNPALGGLKHLSRLESVLAASEVKAAGCDEGLLMDTEDRVIEATTSNLFLLCDGQCLTPDVSTAGVAGVYRAWLAGQTRLTVKALCLDDLKQAEALFLANAVTGIRPVSEVLGIARFATEPVRDFEAKVGSPWSGD